MFKLLKELLLGQRRVEKYRQDQPRLTRSLEHNLRLFQEIFHHDDTILYRQLETRDHLRCVLIFVDGMVNKDILLENVIAPIQKVSLKEEGERNRVIHYFSNRLLHVEDFRTTNKLDEIITSVLYGDTLILVEGVSEGIVIGSKGWQTRGVTEPLAESVVRGPREGFTESLNINLTLIRRKIKEPGLKFVMHEVGFRTRTKICVAYIEGLALKEILVELERRLAEVKVDGILESGYIEEFIKDSPLTPFKTIGHTERPDIVAAKLLEGRIAILCDGTPFALTLPFLFLENFQANEDYYQNFILASLNRIIRYIAFVITTTTPAIYLSLVTYHQEMIPTPLLFSISAARQGVPFPTVLEALLLGFFFELLREGGVRLPNPIGQAVSIVGAIILGDAAVAAKIASAPMIIITAVTGIASFLIPQLYGLSLLLRLTLLVLASFFGLYGVIFGIMGFFVQVMSMRSFGIPYMLYWDAVRPQHLKDTVIRAPWWFMHLRPKLLGKRNPERQPDIFEPERR